MSQEVSILYFFSSASSRGVATSAPNSPRDTGVGDVMPRAINPDIASKSNVKQTICLAMTFSVSISRTAAFGRYRRAGNHARLITRQKQRDIRDVFGFAHPEWIFFAASR